MSGVVGRANFHPNDWLSAAGRAVLFAGTFHVLDQLLRGTLAPLASGGAGDVALFTFATLTAALVAGAVLLRVLDGRSPAALGLALSRQVPRELGIGLLAGIVPHILIVAVLLVAGALRYAPQGGSPGGWAASVLGAGAVLAVAATAEEAVYRGYGFQALVRGFGWWPALLLMSALFAWAHGRNPAVTPLALCNIFLAGIVLGLAYRRTLSLWLVSALHIGWNWAMASLFDLPVSGLTLFDTPLYEPAVGGPAWLGGGSFGPEGGLLGSAGLLLILLVAWRWPGLAPSPAQLAARPLPLHTPEEKQAT